MIHPSIGHLYLYKPANDYTLKIFEEDRLWAAKPERFNDPFDCDLDVTKGISEDDIMNTVYALYGQPERWPKQIKDYMESSFDGCGKYTPNERERIDEEIQALIEDNKNSGVICLSEVNDAILMWSHYGQNHTGICIEFERQPNNKLGDAELCSPVHYSSKYPVIDLGKMLLNRDGQTLNLMLRYKADCWASEKEWRLITDKGDEQCPLPGPISKVIFGLKTPDDFREKIQTLCTAKRIHTVQAYRAQMEFRIIIPA